MQNLFSIVATLVNIIVNRRVAISLCLFENPDKPWKKIL